MKTITKPEVKDWRKLYKAALEFRKIESWQWLSDADIFGVQNPANGEIGYCCVLGNLGQVFGLSVYLGAEGLENYLKIQSGEISPEDIEVQFVQKCLLASFENKSQLDREDLKIIKKLGLNLKGKNSWPQFRSYRPGYYPWYLSKSEVDYLTLVLEQAREVALRLKQEPDLVIGPSDNRYFVRAAKKEANRISWKDDYLEPAPYKRKRKKVKPKPSDEIRLKRIKQDAPKGKETWEIDYSHTPLPVEGVERPFFPYTVLWVEHYSGFIWNSCMVEPEKLDSEFSEQFLKLLENHKSRPQKILVKKKEAFELLKPIAQGLEIELLLVGKLPAAEEAQRSFHAYLNEIRF